VNLFTIKRRVLSVLLILSIFLSFISFPSYADELPEKNPGRKNITRYTVLVLDVSGSMAGLPLSTLKSAVHKFCEDILKAKGDNYVAVITYAASAKLLSDFTNDIERLKSGINSLSASGDTNMNDGLQMADSLLNSIPEDEGVIKNILLFSDGLPNRGSTSSEGPYSSSEYTDYRYANAVYKTAEAIKNKGYSLYTIGFFHLLSGKNLSFARKFMEDLQNEGYYNITSIEELEFVFEKVLDKIQKITGTFKYNGALEDKDSEATFYYSDEYFYGSSYVRNNSLATMSLCLAMSAFASKEKSVPYAEKSRNARDLLEKIGFLDFEVNEFYTKKPETNTIGVVAA